MDVTIFEALNKVKTAIGAVGKGERNAAQGFNFRGIDAVVNAAAPELNRHGIIVCPEVLEHEYEVIEIGKNKTPMGHVTVVAKYTFYGPKGDSVSSTVVAESMDSGDKACAKAMSVAYRIALLQTLNLPTCDPDPDSDSYERTVSVPKTRKTTPAVADWAVEVSSAKTLDRLREVWKEAGNDGALQDSIVTGDGEKMTVQEFLYKKSDELSATKSAN
jgi:ERF superfamily